MNLKAHIRTCHKELAKQLDEEGWPARLEAGSGTTETVTEEEGVLMEAEAVEQETGEMTWVTTGEHGEVVQLAHGDAFTTGTWVNPIGTSSLAYNRFVFSSPFYRRDLSHGGLVGHGSGSPEQHG